MQQQRSERDSSSKDKPDLKERLAREKEIFERDRSQVDRKKDTDKLVHLNQDVAQTFMEQTIYEEMLKQDRVVHDNVPSDMQDATSRKPANIIPSSAPIVSDNSSNYSSFQPPFPMGRPPMPPIGVMGPMVVSNPMMVGSMMPNVSGVVHPYPGHPNQAMYMPSYPGSSAPLMMQQTQQQQQPLQIQIM